MLSACSDYKLTGPGKASSGASDDTAASSDDTGSSIEPQACSIDAVGPEEVGVDDHCETEPPEPGFSPTVEWEYGGFDGCLSLPAVGDLDGDGMPEIAFNNTDLFCSAGTLVVLEGDGSGVDWTSTTAAMGCGSSPTMADLDGDGLGEVVVLREYSTDMWGFGGDYTVVAYSSAGVELWESQHFSGDDLGYAGAPIVSDMDHDGSPEIVAGRVILNASGQTRGVGAYGSGTSNSSGPLPAVTDLDLDGVEEVVTGNTIYGPDADVLWYEPGMDDGFVSIANLDDDELGEFIVISGLTIRAHDTDGSLLWGPSTFPSASNLSPAAIADLDVDGLPEIAFSGQNTLFVLNHDGTTLWTAEIEDESGASGPSVFDFEGDGRPELVHIDEVQVIAFDGPTGEVRFRSTDHASNTLFDYPVIADVDADGNAEIVVCHNGYDSAISIYGDGGGDTDHAWAPAREVWNQHAYSISNVGDDLSVPVNAVPNFVDSNTWHAAVSTSGEPLGDDVRPEILDVCTDECEQGLVWVNLRMANIGPNDLGAGLNLSLYAEIDGRRMHLHTQQMSESMNSGWTTSSLQVGLAAAELVGATAIWASADDDGAGMGVLSECSELDNELVATGPFCD